MTLLLHGFWGQPRDWNSVLQRLPIGKPVLAPDLFSDELLQPLHSLTKWTENFWCWVDHQLSDEPIQLVGYSMGARLAIAAAVKNPARVQRALFLSGNPLWPASAQSEREAWEKEWSAKFLHKDWAELEQQWQEQGLFSGSAPMERRKTPEMREILGLALKNWSPRLHPYGAHEIRALSPNMEWAFGALDQKYLMVAKSLQELPVQGQITIIPNAGHRLTTDAADFISQWI